MWKMTFDDKRHVDVIWNPSTDDIVGHIEVLDNHDRTFVNLENDIGQIAISGGSDGKVMVHCTPDFETGFLMADGQIAWDAGNLEMSVEGQRAQYSARYFVPRSTAIKSVLYFILNHALDEDALWESDQDAQLGAP